MFTDFAGYKYKELDANIIWASEIQDVSKALGNFKTNDNFPTSLRKSKFKVFLRITKKKPLKIDAW